MQMERDVEGFCLRALIPKKDRSIWRSGPNSRRELRWGIDLRNHPPEGWWLNWYDKLSLPKEAGGSLVWISNSVMSFWHTEFFLQYFLWKERPNSTCFTIFKSFTHMISYNSIAVFSYPEFWFFPFSWLVTLICSLHLCLLLFLFTNLLIF